MAYCTTEAVQGQAGRLLDDLSQNPSTAELVVFAGRVSATLDAYLAGAGIATPTTDPTILGALEGTATDGTLVLALEARFQNRAADQRIPALDGARSRWAAALKALAAGTHPALLTANEAAGVGGSFTADEAEGYVPAPLDRLRSTPFNRNTEPELYEGMAL